VKERTTLYSGSSEAIMRGRAISVLAGLVLMVAGAVAQAAKSQDEMVIVFKDGHQQSVAMSSVARIEFKSAETPAASSKPTGASGTAALGVNHFVGKWQVGEGNGWSKFYITLNRDGSAKKTLGGPNGKWALVDNEAQITWDDGWHDAIRKVGSKHQKFAYGPGKSFADDPDNVTDARNTDPSPI
jgi:hypothetical protein